MTEFNCDLEYIVIHDVIDETFYANLILKGHGKKITVDCRPSDAIAIALRFSKPIFVEESVMNKAALHLPEVSEEKSLEHTDTVEQNDDELSPVELLHKKLKDAIRDERYEDAARYRDEIQQLSTAN
jgi:bifunctional DNase/RNase